MVCSLLCNFDGVFATPPAQTNLFYLSNHFSPNVEGERVLLKAHQGAEDMGRAGFTLTTFMI